MAQNIQGTRSYTHTAESNVDLVKKILGRNLQADPAELLALLESVGYYRLKGYLIPFYLPKTEVFAPSTTLTDITSVYMFDRHLREMALDAIARLEVAMRARIVKVVCDQDPNPLAYTDKAFFGNLSAFKHAQLLIQIANNVHRSKNEPFIAHAKQEYGFEDLPPIWTIMEVLSFGTMMDFFEGLSDSMKIKIADEFHVRPSVLSGWFSLIRKVRNVCAHHGRLWNRCLQNQITSQIGAHPLLIPLHDCLIAQTKKRCSSVFTALSVIAYCVQIVRPQSGWKRRCKALLSNASPFTLHGMDVPANWQQMTLWQ